ncbi:MAG: hypothetical protein LWX55_14230 [Deltaproteobacteria bacterium]|nr:hypothetical protein [Deltaproteobacteria bacterium]
MMRDEYTDKGTLFDLVLIESTCLDKKWKHFPDTNEKSPILLTFYTEDGSHLNEFGSKTVAEQLLIFLATL